MSFTEYLKPNTLDHVKYSGRFLPNTVIEEMNAESNEDSPYVTNSNTKSYHHKENTLDCRPEFISFIEYLQPNTLENIKVP